MRAAGVSVFHAGMVLLAKRIDTYKGKPVPFGGYWSIFAGAVENIDLSPRHAAQRELQEETQITAPLDDLIYLDTIERPDTSLAIYSYTVNEALLPTLDYEHTECGWFTISSLDSFPSKLDSRLLESIKLYRPAKK
jgi:ADP-ribose pyrophosphatase YjhB (NUDIX family)